MARSSFRTLKRSRSNCRPRSATSRCSPPASSSSRCPRRGRTPHPLGGRAGNRADRPHRRRRGPRSVHRQHLARRQPDVCTRRIGRGASLPVEKPVTGGWVQMGYRHVLPEGRDHILFILGIFLLAPNWRSLLGQSLLFTLAHSITLALAVFKVVTVPDPLLGIRQSGGGLHRDQHRLHRYREPAGRARSGQQRLILDLHLRTSPRSRDSPVPSGKKWMPSRCPAHRSAVRFQYRRRAGADHRPRRRVPDPEDAGKWTIQVQTFGSVFVAFAGIAWAVQRIWFPPIRFSN